MIVKRGKKFAVVSHKTGKTLATYNTRAAAEADLRRRKRFRKEKR